ncbi:unnamed protein product [Protopolystoma xenopodis]|uniref:Uncharacterized protein n=1 Tax=Protopolystoma xenopodis TaxID=117903 RepID=A0A3S5BVD5_9PLAT|nr:unnamed protein product [Protopolystoma xenopodis]
MQTADRVPGLGDTMSTHCVAMPPTDRQPYSLLPWPRNECAQSARRYGEVQAASQHRSPGGVRPAIGEEFFTSDVPLKDDRNRSEFHRSPGNKANDEQPLLRIYPLHEEGSICDSHRLDGVSLRMSLGMSTHLLGNFRIMSTKYMSFQLSGGWWPNSDGDFWGSYLIKG